MDPDRNAGPTAGAIATERVGSRCATIGVNRVGGTRMFTRMPMLVLSTALAACVPIPLPKSDAAEEVALPDVRAVLPRDIQTDTREILVLAEATRLHHPSFFANRRTAQSGGYVLQADFIAGTDLERLTDKFQLRSSRRLLVVTFMLTGHEAYYTDSLRLLCLVTADGRTFALTPGETGWTQVREDHVGAGRYAAFIANMQTPPQRGQYVVGPCGAAGAIDWSAALRSRVEEFLLRVPTAP